MAVTAAIVPQADSVVNQTLYAPALTSASGSIGPFPVDFFNYAEITVAVTTCSGTLDVYVQRLLPDNATYDDQAHFPQISTGTFTTTGTYSYAFGLNQAGGAWSQLKTASLVANATTSTFFGSYWNISYVLGTNATANFGVYGAFRR